jgi:putative phage-type endonuclease
MSDIQGTDDWRIARLGKVTASRVADVMATTKNGEAATRKNYMMELLCERLTGQSAEGFTSAAMQRGIDLEPMARTEYEIQNGLLVSETGLVDHPTIAMFAASPDGLINNDGLIEIKCPNTAQHVDFLLTGTIPPRYVWQMTAQMECTGRAWCDYVSYDDRMPAHLMLQVKRLHIGDTQVKLMVDTVRQFLDQLSDLEHQLRNIHE